MNQIEVSDHDRIEHQLFLLASDVAEIRGAVHRLMDWILIMREDVRQMRERRDDDGKRNS